jgi:CubicO group peptidase (beta-lactamase class C family)
MQLHEAGTIDLDKDINNYLPWAVEIPNFNNDSITVRQLMTHTSSINDNWGTMSSYYGYPDPTISLANCMGSYFPTIGSDYNATGNFLNSAPGTSYHYSNMASALNGYLVEVSSGIPFDDYCDNNLFNPLCMENTAWHFSDFNSDQVAIPYSYQNGNYLPYSHYGFADYPNGQLRTNILDLGNFMIAILNGGTLGSNTILNPSTVNEMLSFQIPLLDTTQGLNWYRTKLYHSGGEAMLWGHSGGEKGVNTHLFLDPSTNIGICVLTNGEGDGLYICDDLYDHVLNMNVNSSIVPNCIPTISVNELDSKKEKIVIYPNPTNGIFNINLSHNTNGNIILFDLIGKEVLRQSFNSNSVRLNIKSLKSKGTYFVKVIDLDGNIITINKLIYQ